jgi:hypothetical protein
MNKSTFRIKIAKNIVSAIIRSCSLFFIINKNLSLIDKDFLLFSKPIIIIFNPIIMLIHINVSLKIESEIVLSTSPM